MGNSGPRRVKECRRQAGIGDYEAVIAAFAVGRCADISIASDRIEHTVVVPERQRSRQGRRKFKELPWSNPGCSISAP